MWTKTRGHPPHFQGFVTGLEAAYPQKEVSRSDVLPLQSVGNSFKGTQVKLGHILHYYQGLTAGVRHSKPPP